jgi:hypothetical protein
MEPSAVQLLFDFRRSELSEEQQEKLTQVLWHQMRDLDGIQVERVIDPNPPEGSRSIGAFLWGLLQAKVTRSSVKNLLSFLGDRLGNQPIKIKVKLIDGRTIEIEARSRAELLAAEQTIQRLLKA